MTLKYYLMETFEPTILFGFFSALLGVAAAWHYGRINLIVGLLAVAGVVLAQIAVNLIDDYEDYSSGLDMDTSKTKFSGGSVLVTKKLVRLDYVLAIGMTAFGLAALIGAYIIYHNILLLPFALVGVITVLCYAKFLSRVPFFAEPLTALNFAFICLACFIAAGGPPHNVAMFWFAAVAVGVQVGITVLVNYMPDRRADRKHGRRNVVVMIDSNRGTAWLYLVLEAFSFLLVICGAALGSLPLASLWVLVTLPGVLAVSCSIARYKNPKSFEKVMANATLAELVFIMVLILAFI